MEVSWKNPYEHGDYWTAPEADSVLVELVLATAIELDNYKRDISDFIQEL